MVITSCHVTSSWCHVTFSLQSELTVLLKGEAPGRERSFTVSVVCVCVCVCVCGQVYRLPCVHPKCSRLTVVHTYVYHFLYHCMCLHVCVSVCLQVSIKYVARVSLSLLEEALKGIKRQITFDGIQALDVIMRHLPSMT